jgi:hypothetical protein
MKHSDIIIDNNSDRFIERLMKENLWAKEYTLRVIEEYKKFVYLATLQEVAPSYEVDQVWHTHLLFTKDYKKMCKETLGVELHHNPIEKTAVRTTGKDQYQETKRLYQKVFGYEPPADIWTTWKKTSYTYIDLESHWVVPVGDWKALFKLLIKQIKI